MGLYISCFIFIIFWNQKYVWHKIDVQLFSLFILLEKPQLGNKNLFFKILENLSVKLFEPGEYYGIGWVFNNHCNFYPIFYFSIVPKCLFCLSFNFISIGLSNFFHLYSYSPFILYFVFLKSFLLFVHNQSCQRFAFLSFQGTSFYFCSSSLLFLSITQMSLFIFNLSLLLYIHLFTIFLSSTLFLKNFIIL